jgi:hypothetical protein
MGAAIRTSSQPPDLEGIDIAKDGVTSLGRLANTVNIFQDPFDLRT